MSFLTKANSIDEIDLIETMICNAHAPEMATAASLGRIYQHYLKSDEKSWGILSAWDASREFVDLLGGRKKNKAKTSELLADLKALGLGYNSLEGRWKANGVVQKEPSFFVLGITKAQIKQLRNKYDQEAVVYCGKDTANKVTLLRANNSEADLGSFRPLAIGDIYSKIKGKSFSFASVPSGGWASQLVQQSIAKSSTLSTEITDLKIKLKRLRFL